MILEEVKNILKAFDEKHNIKQDAFDSCRVAMTNALKDNPNGLRGFQMNEIKLEFIGQEIIFEHYLYHTPIVKTRIGLYKKKENTTYIRNLEPIGYYELDTDIHGVSFDDWLIIDEEKNNQIEIVYDLNELYKSLPKKYFRRNSIYYEYISYIAHIATLYQARDLATCQLFMKRAFEFIQKTEIKNDFKSFALKSQKFIKRVAAYLSECELLEDAFINKFEDLGIIKRTESNT